MRCHGYRRCAPFGNKKRTQRRMASLRVERHPRGHVASCNGKVERLNTRVESYSKERIGSASENALMVEVWTNREKERKAHQLESFQKRVKQRVCQRERERQQEIATVSSQLVQSEQRAAEKAVKLDKIKVPRSVEVGHDIEDIKVIASAKATHVPQCPGKPSASQVARRSLLTKMATVNEQTSNETVGMSDDSRHAPYKDTVHYQAVSQLSHTCNSNLPVSYQSGEIHQGKSWSNNFDEKSQLNLKQGVPNLKEVCSTLHKYTAAGQLEHAQKKQAAQQYHVFRKLYSDLERAQARQKQLQLTHNQRVEKLKKRKEASRRVAEDEANLMDSCSFVSTEAAEDQQRAAEWEELMAEESRRQQLQKNQEMDRYIQALRVRLKEQLESRKLDVPPLCACGLSLWDSSPDTCANNCIFYKNPRAYAKALSNLLVSLEL